MPAKFTSRTSWRAKLEKAQEPVIFEIPENMTKRFGTGTMVIPRPLDVDALIRKVKKGKLVTTALLRARLAADCDADVACPMTTGIFIRIASEAAEEDFRNGKSRITPYWRVVRDDGSLNEKFPGGTAAQARRLKSEGFKIVPGKGKKPPKVAEFERFLIKFR